MKEVGKSWQELCTERHAPTPNEPFKSETFLELSDEALEKYCADVRNIFSVLKVPQVGQRREIHSPKISTQNNKSSEQAFLKNFCWAPGTCHGESGSSCANICKSLGSCKRSVCLVFLDFGWGLGLWVGYWRQSSSLLTTSENQPR